MKIKEKCVMEITLEEEEKNIIEKAVKFIDDILYNMYDKDCNYLSYNYENHGSYSTETLEELREGLCNIIGTDSIYR